MLMAHSGQDDAEGVWEARVHECTGGSVAAETSVDQTFDQPAGIAVSLCCIIPFAQFNETAGELRRAITAALVASGLSVECASAVCFTVTVRKDPGSLARTWAVRTCSPEAKKLVRKALMGENAPVTTINGRRALAMSSAGDAKTTELRYRESYETYEDTVHSGRRLYLAVDPRAFDLRLTTAPNVALHGGGAPQRASASGGRWCLRRAGHMGISHQQPHAVLLDPVIQRTLAGEAAASVAVGTARGAIRSVGRRRGNHSFSEVRLGEIEIFRANRFCLSIFLSILADRGRQGRYVDTILSGNRDHPCSCWLERLELLNAKKTAARLRTVFLSNWCER